MPKDALGLLKKIDKGLPRGIKAEVVIAPPSPLLAYLRSEYGGKRVNFAAQTISADTLGAHTGEVPAESARAAGARYTLVGHAERRARGESDEYVARLTRAALDAGLIPIICIGEGERDKEGHYFAQIEKGLAASLARVLPHELARVVIAYEPVWAIGAAVAPGGRVVSEAALYIRKTLAALYGRDAALKTRILYGGAVDATSAPELLREGNVNGFLVGRASVDPVSFIGILRACL